MIQKFLLSTFVAALAVAPLSTAFASADCKKHPKEEWLTEEAMKKKITDAGYVIDKFKIDGECYEIYGKDKDGNKVEIYYDTKDGSPVKTKIKKK